MQTPGAARQFGAAHGVRPRSGPTPPYPCHSRWRLQPSCSVSRHRPTPLDAAAQQSQLAWPPYIMARHGAGSVDKRINEVLPNNDKYKGWERARIHIDPGAVDIVGPKSVGCAFPTKETRASKAGNNYIAANGSPIKNYGERLIKGETENSITVSMPIQIADVKRTLMSTHKMNQTGMKVVLDGINSYFIEKKTGKSTPP